MFALIRKEKCPRDRERLKKFRYNDKPSRKQSHNSCARENEGWTLMKPSAPTLSVFKKHESTTRRNDPLVSPQRDSREADAPPPIS